MYSIFQAACAARGLLATDDEWHRCIEEAGLTHTGHKLQQLFAVILLNNSPLDPNNLLRHHMHNLSDDCRHGHVSISISLLTNKSKAWQLSIFVHRARKTLADYHLPTPSVDFNNLNGLPRIIAEERSYNKTELKAGWEQGYIQADLSDYLRCPKIVGIHLHTPVFSDGQLYVAISQATNCWQIFISLSPTADGILTTALQILSNAYRVLRTWVIP